MAAGTAAVTPVTKTRLRRNEFQHGLLLISYSNLQRDIELHNVGADDANPVIIHFNELERHGFQNISRLETDSLPCSSSSQLAADSSSFVEVFRSTSLGVYTDTRQPPTSDFISKNACFGATLSDWDVEVDSDSDQDSFSIWEDSYQVTQIPRSTTGKWN
ncbi:hypothetical protein C8J56DRAFT_880513 [Mycena floridula]|nr:hypothetical protein C8J56DRAFT_880513 [Mycena floridula]